ncbi:CIS tube protein [Ideonella sp. YS5]|uniref:CIS tube protein n=1 Tax=Ideonella sp. YS5 TaxID=3453714 RepID=UPI003EF00F24
MELEKLNILIEKNGTALEFGEPGSDDSLEALFNPAQLALSRTVKWESHVMQRDVLELQYVGSEPASLVIDLTFDTYDTPKPLAEKDSVKTTYIDKLMELTRVEDHGALHRPPLCQLNWGVNHMLFQGVLEQLNTTYTMFLPSGLPVRATAHCSLKQWLKGVDDRKRQNLMSADVAKVWIVQRGQTLATIAAKEYGDPRQWRAIAKENDLDDPLTLYPGQRLLLPVRRSGLAKGTRP